MGSISRTLSLVTTVIVMSGCATSPTWTNHGVGALKTSSGMIVCYTDANLIDGERMEGSLCATHESGFLGGGEPEIKFGPWGRKFMSAKASETTEGVRRDYRGKAVLLKCAPVLSEDQGRELGRDCVVTVNDQHLVSAVVHFAGR